MMRIAFSAALAALALMSHGTGLAQGAPATVSANNPEGVAAAMQYAGYPVEIKKDNVGDPMIETEFAGYNGVVYFYGCNEDTHTDCQSLQFRTGFDSEKPMQLAALNALLAKYRFISIHTDDEGDQWVQYDIVTLDGIPAPVLLKALDHFSWSAAEVGDVVFAD